MLQKYKQNNFRNKEMQLKENGEEAKKRIQVFYGARKLIMGKNLFLWIFLEEDSSTFQEVFTLDDKQLW